MLFSIRPDEPKDEKEAGIAGTVKERVPHLIATTTAKERAPAVTQEKDTRIMERDRPPTPARVITAKVMNMARDQKEAKDPKAKDMERDTEKDTIATMITIMTIIRYVETNDSEHDRLVTLILISHSFFTSSRTMKPNKRPNKKPVKEPSEQPSEVVRSQFKLVRRVRDSTPQLKHRSPLIHCTPPAF